ncbi:MAG: FMN-binding protein [Ignavibacteriaceae bacterium]|nr:FMN-binding protein [Ignavibacteriaceae bacterium]
MNNTTKMLITLGFIGIVAGGSLSFVNNWATPLIAANQKAETERAIFLVQPEAKSYERIDNLPFEAYKVFDENKTFVGYSLPYEGNGFQGKIRLMVGLSTDLNNIIAMEVLDQIETPGLGTKILEEPFKDQFKNLNSSSPIEWVKGSPPSKDNEIQAITGATISSKAIVAIINNGIEGLKKAELKGEEK